MADRNRADGQLAGILRKARVSRRIQVAAIRWLGLQSHYAKRALCDDSGQVSADAERLIALLAQEARLNRRGFQPDAERRLFDLGAQHIVRVLIDWIEMDSSRLARLEQQLKDDMKGTTRD